MEPGRSQLAQVLLQDAGCSKLGWEQGLHCACKTTRRLLQSSGQTATALALSEIKSDLTCLSEVGLR